MIHYDTGFWSLRLSLPALSPVRSRRAPCRSRRRGTGSMRDRPARRPRGGPGPPVCTRPSSAAWIRTWSTSWSSRSDGRPLLAQPLKKCVWSSPKYVREFIRTICTINVSYRPWPNEVKTLQVWVEQTFITVHWSVNISLFCFKYTYHIFTLHRGLSHDRIIPTLNDQGRCLP